MLQKRCRNKKMMMLFRNGKTFSVKNLHCEDVNLFVSNDVEKRQIEDFEKMQTLKIKTRLKINKFP